MNRIKYKGQIYKRVDADNDVVETLKKYMQKAEAFNREAVKLQKRRLQLKAERSKLGREVERLDLRDPKAGEMYKTIIDLMWSGEAGSLFNG